MFDRRKAELVISSVPFPPQLVSCKNSASNSPKEGRSVHMRSSSVVLYADYNITFSPNNRKSNDALYAKSSKFSGAYNPQYRKKEFSFAADKRQKNRSEKTRQTLAGRQIKVKESLQKERKISLAMKVGNDYRVKLPRIQRFSVNENLLVGSVISEAKRSKEDAAAKLIQRVWSDSKKMKQLKCQVELRKVKEALAKSSMEAELKKLNEERAAKFIQAYWLFTKKRQALKLESQKNKLRKSIEDLDRAINRLYFKK
mmetsp:Transcript_1902/g.4207  ORF Transcript_1902/g.4207 Transcript_1902/m.4207 type:complete len:256 (+) Transcript_1902:249-1016(+)